MRGDRAFVLILFSAVSFVLLSAISPSSAYLLPDTNQTRCYSTKGQVKVVSCPPPGNALAQDGSYLLHAPSYTTYGNGTVLDNNTWLMWQQSDDGIRRTWQEAIAYCRDLTLGGFTGWRLPNKMELLSIVNYGHLNTLPLMSQPYHYLTQPESACNGGTFWAVDFGWGSPLYVSMSTGTYYTRCVLGAELPEASFFDNGDNTITDLSTGLSWQKQGRSGLTWGSALSYCEGLSLGGYSDWRLPNIKELATIHESPNLSDYFAGLGTSYPHWSSTTITGSPTYVWAMHMNTRGMEFSASRDSATKNNYTRCLRGGQTVAVVKPEIQVSSGQLEFWQVGTYSRRSATLTITNNGRSNLSLGSIPSISGPFAISFDGCTHTTLPPFNSCNVIIEFNGNVEGNYQDTLTISSNDPVNPLLSISISGIVRQGFLLPDTSQTACFNNSGYLGGACPAPESPLAQDGSYNINVPSYSVHGNGTISDNNTLLMWQQQGDAGPRSWEDALNYCESLTLAGHSDWRLPDFRELISIVNYGRYRPTIDVSVFPGTREQYYWTAAVSSASPDKSWAVDFATGSFGPHIKTEVEHVRCVRGTKLPWDTFVNNQNSTSTDVLTGLTWQQQDTVVSNWEAALSYCENLSLGGHTDWRLPNIKEYAYLIDPRYSPVVDPSFISDLACGQWPGYWSSTTYLANLIYPQQYVPDDAYMASFVSGAGWGDSNHKFYNNYSARCVRGGAIRPALLLAITSPQDGTAVNNSPVSITGTVNNNATVSVNGIPASVSDGAFSASVVLNQGPNVLTVTAMDLYGQTVSQNITVTLVSKGALAGSITDELTGLPLASVSISATDAENSTFTALTDNYGRYAVADLAPGLFLLDISKVGYVTETIGGTIRPGQTVTLNSALSPILPALTNIAVSEITIDSALVTWTTDQPCDSRVEYGTSESYGDILTDGSLTTDHSLLLTNLDPGTIYHFRVVSANTYDLSSASADGTFSTMTFTARSLGDFGNTAVMEVNGSYNARRPDGTINELPRQEIAKEFLRTHPDQYDFIVVVSNFDFAMPQAEAKGFYLEVKNGVQGIGKAMFDNSAAFGSNGKLQGVIDMGNVADLGLDPFNPIPFDQTLNTLAHEQLHRWGAGVKFREAGGSISTALYGKDNAHWSYLMDTDGSLMYGNDWRDNGDGTFTSVSASRYYSALDLYLMGMIDKADVSPMTLIENAAVDPTKLPEIGASISGMAKTLTIDDITTAEGERVPNAATSQKTFKTAFIFIARPGTFVGTEPAGIEMLRSAWAGRFAELTHGKGNIADVQPTLSLTVTSPAEGQAIAGPDIMVRGTLINSTGNETGVTVNGVVAVVYGNQFIANHVPLAEGQNTITITATDTAGNTESISATVNAETTGNYLRLISNIESGIAPLEVLLRVDGSFIVTASNLNVIGPVQPEVLSAAPEEYKLKFTVEGVYYVTVTVAGPDGATYQDTVAITVLNRTQLDYLLKAKWEGMKAALMAGDVETSVSYFVLTSHDRYRQIFTELSPSQINSIFSNIIEFKVDTLLDDTAECSVLRYETGGIYSYPLAFVSDGIWKIMGF